uniref:Uncharacterized protein n=1 Tax=Nothobranchius furzeri TaxID=105023 RepID=A0A8C6PIW0_NOTFU
PVNGIKKTTIMWMGHISHRQSRTGKYGNHLGSCGNTSGMYRHRVQSD